MIVDPGSWSRPSDARGAKTRRGRRDWLKMALLALVPLVAAYVCILDPVEGVDAPVAPIDAHSEERSEAVQPKPDSIDRVPAGGAASASPYRWRCVVTDKTLGSPVRGFWSATPHVVLSPLGSGGIALGESAPGVLFDLVAPGYRRLTARAPVGDVTARFFLEPDTEVTTVKVVGSAGGQGVARVWARSGTARESFVGVTGDDGILRVVVPSGTELSADVDGGFVAPWTTVGLGGAVVLLVLEKGAQVRFRDRDVGEEVGEVSALLTSSSQRYWCTPVRSVVPFGVYDVYIDPECSFLLSQGNGASSGLVRDRMFEREREWIDVAPDNGVRISVRDAVSGVAIEEVWSSCFLRRPGSDLAITPSCLRRSSDGVFLVQRQEQVAANGLASYVKVWALGYDMTTVDMPSAGLNLVSLQPRASQVGVLRLRSRTDFPVECIKIRDSGLTLCDLEWQDLSKSIAVRGGYGVTSVECNFSARMDLPRSCVSVGPDGGWLAEVDLDQLMGRIVVTGVPADVSAGLQCAVGDRVLNGFRFGDDFMFPYVPPGDASVCIAGTPDHPSASSLWGKVEVVAGRCVNLDGSSLRSFGPCDGLVEIRGPLDHRDLWVVPFWGSGGLLRFRRDYAVPVDRNGAFRVGALPTKPTALVLFRGRDPLGGGGGCFHST